jgi:hypothetical protein
LRNILISCNNNSSSIFDTNSNKPVETELETKECITGTWVPEKNDPDNVVVRYEFSAFDDNKSGDPKFKIVYYKQKLVKKIYCI